MRKLLFQVRLVAEARLNRRLHPFAHRILVLLLVLAVDQRVKVVGSLFLRLLFRLPGSRRADVCACVFRRLGKQLQSEFQHIPSLWPYRGRPVCPLSGRSCDLILSRRP